MTAFVPLSEFATVERFRDHLAELGVGLDLDMRLEAGPDAPLAKSLTSMGHTVGNRFCVHPMEGWDADIDGRPTAHTRRRWRASGRSGAKLLWNESIAVHPLGRSSPEQLLFAASTLEALTALRGEQVDAHVEAHGTADDLLVGVQLTHSGRHSHPDGRSRPVAVRRHPLFDETLGPSADAPLLTDDELRSLIGDYVQAAELARRAGFDFVDIKSCHGYLSHELLGAFERPGDFGGSFENRTRFLRDVIAGAHDAVPDLGVAVRLSAFDTITHEPDEHGVGRPITDEPFRYWFGTDPSGHHIDLSEPIALLAMLRDLSVELVSITGSSPYSVRHYQTPTAPRPGEHYISPENPLYGVARHLSVTASLKRAVPQMTYVGGGYSYLQQFLPHVAQARVRRGQVDLVGIGRMHLASPDAVPAMLAGRRPELDGSYF
jgi:2,4-dienoyl-CoA reductase-like NADH-dependent reductase (Old Yellow Enzyme family)